MAKIPNEVKVSIQEEIIENMLKKYIIDIEKILIEKIAFSLFIMHYYKHNFIIGESDLYYNIQLEKEKEMWKLGKEKNKLKFFFDLAEKIYKLNFND